MRSIQFITTFISLALLGCTQRIDVPDRVTIAGSINNNQGSRFEVVSYLYPSSGLNVLANIIPDSAFSVQFELSDPMQVFISAGMDQLEMYLKPGDSLYLQADGRAFIESVEFSGRGASINSYLVNKFRILEQHERNYDKAGLSLKEFTSNENILLSQLIEHLSTSVDPSNPFYNVEDAAITAQWINRRHYFTLTYSDREARYKNNYWDKLPMDKEIALINRNFRTALDNLYNQKVMASVSDPDNYSTGYHNVFQDLLQLNSDGITDYLLASNINNRIDYYGIKDLKDDYLQYRESFPTSPYLISIEQKYQAWDRLTPGNPAPDVSFYTKDGQVVSISDFKGKPIYIDVWASWCKPCLEEIPFRKKLSETFSEDELILLNVSIDEQSENWLAAMNKYPEFTGFHVLADKGWSSSIMQDYLIQEIPKYIIIDQDGNIVTLEAPPPSSEDLIEMLRDLIPSI